MDVGTGLALLGTAKLVEKLLGPTAEYVGDGLKHWTETRVRNVNRIFANATRILGDRINSPGAVPPKVLKGILAEGAFSDDQLTAEYFGGVLASSRSGVLRDDRGASIIAMISRLSTYQIRAHYCFYRVAKDLYDGSDISPNLADNAKKLQVYIPFPVFFSAMAFDTAEIEQISQLLGHILWGLSKERLIAEEFASGADEVLKQYCRVAPEPGLVFRPTASGVELFLWGHGLGERPTSTFFSVDVKLAGQAGISIPAGSLKASG